MSDASRTSRILARRALLLLFAVLCAGVAAHCAHHLLDPPCRPEAGAGADPCVCCSASAGALAQGGAALVSLPQADARPVCPPPSPLVAGRDPDRAHPCRAPPAA